VKAEKPRYPRLTLRAVYRRTEERGFTEDRRYRYRASSILSTFRIPVFSNSSPVTFTFFPAN
jgi:hypothetical protein